MTWFDLNKELLKACVRHDRAREARLHRILIRKSLLLHRFGREGEPGSTIGR